MCLEQTMQQHPGTHEPFASKKPQTDVAVHVTLGHVTAGVGAVLPASPWASHPQLCAWGSVQLAAVLPVHLTWCVKPSKESKIVSALLWGIRREQLCWGAAEN